MSSPLEVFAEAAKLNPTIARYAAGILIALSVVATATGWWEGDWTTPVIGLVVVLVGIFMMMVLQQIPKIIGHPEFQSTMRWFVRGILLLLYIVMASATSYGVAGVPATFPCTIRFGADGCSRLVAAPPDAPAAAAAPVVAPPAAQAVNRSAYTVYVQFAGYVREDIDAVRSALAKSGWTVPRAERLGAAARLHEIRYRAASDETAAAVLADEIAKAGLKAPKIRQVDIITPGTLEVWTGIDVGR